MPNYLTQKGCNLKSETYQWKPQGVTLYTAAESFDGKHVHIKLLIQGFN